MGDVVETPGHRFSAPIWVRALSVFGALAFPASAYFVYTAQGWSWLALGSVVLAVFAAAGAVDAFTSKVELFPERMVVVANLRRREYPRSAFVDVSWAKGVPVTLKFGSGGYLRLPGVGSSAQGVTNSLRAWLRKQSAGAT